VRVTRHRLHADLQEAHHALRVEVDDEGWLVLDVERGEFRLGGLAFPVLPALLVLLRVLGVGVLAFTAVRGRLFVGVTLVHEEPDATARAEREHGRSDDDQQSFLAATFGGSSLLLFVLRGSFGRCGTGIRHRLILADETSRARRCKVNAREVRRVVSGSEGKGNGKSESVMEDTREIG
jgi:hypothetical protein